MTKWVLSCICLFVSYVFSSNPIKAESSPNVFEPTQYPQTLALTEYKRIGQAEFTFLFWDIYQSYLYTSTGKYSAHDNSDNTIVFQINYLRDISRQELIENTQSQWQHLNSKPEQFNRYLLLLDDLWPDIRQGDSLAIVVTKELSYFYFNNEYLGQIDDKKFGQQFLDIWLSEQTSEPKLRQKLLGLP